MRAPRDPGRRGPAAALPASTMAQTRWSGNRISTGTETATASTRTARSSRAGLRRSAVIAQQALRRELCQKLDDVGSDDLWSRRVHGADRRHDLPDVVGSVAKLPDVRADVVEGEVTAAHGIEENDGLGDALGEHLPATARVDRDCSGVQESLRKRLKRPPGASPDSAVWCR